MIVTIFNGSPRKEGNTSALVDRIVSEISSHDVSVNTVSLYDKSIKGCSNCESCQKSSLKDICTINDDMRVIYDDFLRSDIVVLASPIYMWQLTPCSLAFLNRLHALQSADLNINRMKGKRMALATTLGDAGECADSAISGIMDFCEYFEIDYRGMVRISYAERADILNGKYDTQIAAFVNKLL